jgi:hypothetical protein
MSPALQIESPFLVTTPLAPLKDVYSLASAGVLLEAQPLVVDAGPVEVEVEVESVAGKVGQGGPAAGYIDADVAERD